MSKNLRSKISNILDDVETLSKEEAISRIEHLVESELDFKQQEHSITDHDLTVIGSSAIDIFNKTPVSIGSTFAGNTRKLSTLSMVQSIVGFFRNKGLIAFTISYKEKK